MSADVSSRKAESSYLLLQMYKQVEINRKLTKCKEKKDFPKTFVWLKISPNIC